MKFLILMTFAAISLTSKTYASEQLTLMSYNVENLFDTNHDEGKDDWEYLPSAHPLKEEGCSTIENERYRRFCFEKDWSEALYQKKLDAVAGVILSAAEKGSLPDVIGLVEIENEVVVGDLASRLGYKNFIAANGPDKRGIDVAIIFSDKLKLIESREIELKGEYFKTKPTRTILEVLFETPDGESLVVAVNHWPSQSNPATTRMKAAAAIKKSLFKRKLLNRAHYVALGDFNVVPSDFPHPFHEKMFKGIYKFQDAGELFDSSDAPASVKTAQPLGTYFYAKEMAWNRLDRFFVDSSLTDGKGWELDRASFRIITTPESRTSYVYKNPGSYHAGTTVPGTPFRFAILEDGNTEGVSDHFPVLVRLKKN